MALFANRPQPSADKIGGDLSGPNSAWLPASRAALIVADHGDPVAARRRLYLEVYAGGFVGGRRRTRLSSLVAVDRRFVSEIESANSHTMRATGNLLAPGEEVTVLTVDGVRVSVPTGLLQADEEGSLGWRVPALTLGPSPGHIAMGGMAGGPLGALTRVYLNAGPHQVPALMQLIPKQLNVAGLRFWIKALAHPASYFRRDSMVLYVSSAEVESAVNICRRCVATDGLRLRRGTPLMTLTVARGIGLADEPDDVRPDDPERSHGIVVADWLFKAVEGQSDPEMVALQLRSVIAESGRDPDAPHLRAVRR